MTLADVTHRLAQRRIPFTVWFKDIFGCAIAAVVVVGAIFALAHADFPILGQVVTALVGAAAGAYGAWVSSKPAARD